MKKRSFNRRLFESENSGYALNISLLNKTYPDMVFNDLMEAFESKGASVKGTVKDGDVYMIIYGIDSNVFNDIADEFDIDYDTLDLAFFPASELLDNFNLDDINSNYIDSKNIKDSNVKDSFDTLDDDTFLSESCCGKKPSKKVSLKEEIDKGLLQVKAKSKEEIEKILDDIKTNELDEKTAKKAFDKLKSEKNKLEKKDLSIEDVISPKKYASLLKKLSKFYPKALSLKESYMNKFLKALDEGKRSLHPDDYIDEEKISLMSDEKIIKNINECASLIKKYKRLSSRLNEGSSYKIQKLQSFNEDTIKMKKILEEEILYRDILNSLSGKKSLLFEEENKENKDKNEDFSLDFDSKDTDADTDKNNNIDNDDSVSDNKSDDNEYEDVELTGIEFTMKNKEAADEFVDTLVNNGIPEDALEIIEEDNSTNESFRYTRNYKKLFEEDDMILNEEDDDEDENSESSDKEEKENNESSENPVIVRLTDTNYTSQVADILEKEYGYSKEEFEDKIGGSIIDDESSDDDSNKEDKDKEKDENKSDGDSDEEISLDDIFKDM